MIDAVDEETEEEELFETIAVALKQAKVSRSSPLPLSSDRKVILIKSVPDDYLVLPYQQIIEIRRAQSPRS